MTNFNVFCREPLRQGHPSIKARIEYPDGGHYRGVSLYLISQLEMHLASCRLDGSWKCLHIIIEEPNNAMCISHMLDQIRMIKHTEVATHACSVFFCPSMSLLHVFVNNGIMVIPPSLNLLMRNYQSKNWGLI